MEQRKNEQRRQEKQIKIEVTDGKRRRSRRREGNAKGKEKKKTSTHPIDDEQLAAYVRARLAREEDDRPGKILRLAPAARRDPLADLPQARRVREQALVPKYHHRQYQSVWKKKQKR